MSFFTEANNDAVTVTPDRAAEGPRVGFLRAFETSYNAQVRSAALFGIQNAMREREDAQRKALQEAGVENIPSMSRLADDPFRLFTDYGDDYINAARFFESDVPENVREETMNNAPLAERLRGFDERVIELRKQYPNLNLETSSEMWQGVRKAAQEFEQKQSTERADFGGAIGGFVGGAIGSLNPNSDPVNFATLPIGGAGKTVVTRIAGQAGAQGVVETVNQITGVQEQRQLLGVDYGFADAAMRVGGAVVGGAAVQGAGEVIGAGFRRLFRATPKDPVPKIDATPSQPPPRVDVPEGVVPDDEAAAASVLVQRPQAYYDFMREVSPTGTTRLGRAKAQEDIQHVEQQLDSWEGPQPWAVPPATAVASRVDLNGTVRAPDLSGAAANASIDAIARRVDPQTMGRYDKLADEKARLRQQIDGLGAERDIGSTDPRVEEITEELLRTEAKIAKASAKNRKKLGKTRDDLRAERDAIIERLASTDSPAMADARKQLVAVDEKMRDMAEVVSRAYARARGKWAATEAEQDAVIQMMRDARRDIGPTLDAGTFVDNVQRTIEQDVPMVLERPAGLKEDADAADIVNAVLDKRAEKVDEARETFRTEISRILGDAEKFDELDDAGKQAAREKAKAEDALPPGQYRIEGFEEPISLNDRLDVVDDDGNVKTITIREMLEQQRDAEEDLMAVQTCSIR